MVYDWQNHQGILYQLYVEENKPLDEVMRILKREKDFDPR